MDDEVAAAKKKLDEAKKAAAPKVVSKVGALIPVVKKELDDLKATFEKKEKKRRARKARRLLKRQQRIEKQLKEAEILKAKSDATQVILKAKREAA